MSSFTWRSTYLRQQGLDRVSFFTMSMELNHLVNMDVPFIIQLVQLHSLWLCYANICL